MSDVYAENHQKDPPLVQFDKYTDLPVEAQRHLATLEDFISSVDGYDKTRWQNDEGSAMHGIDEGTIDAENAIYACNKLAALLRGPR